MKPFLENVAAHILANHPTDLADVVICFPNNRVGYFFVDIIKSNIQQTIILPAIYTFQDWIISQSNFKVIDGIALKIKLYKIYQGLGGTDDFQKFLQIADTLLTDFDEIDSSYVNENRFFKNLIQLKSLNNFLEVDNPFIKNYQAFWRLFEQLFFALRTELTNEKLAYKGLIYRNVVDNIATIDLSYVSKIYFVGFTGFSKTEELIVSNLVENGKAVFIPDVDSYYLNDNKQEAGFFYRKYAANWWKKNPEFVGDSLANETKNINIIGAAKNIGQAKVVGDIICNKLSKNDLENSQTAIVLLDANMLFPVLDNMADFIDNINVSMGYPLSDTLTFEFLKSLKAAFLSMRIEKDLANPLFYFESLLSLLNHNFLAVYYDGFLQQKKLIEFIHINNILFINKNDVESFFVANFNLLWSVFATNSETKTLNEKIISLFEIIYHKIKTPKNTVKYSRDIIALEYLLGAIKSLPEAVFEMISVDDYFDLLINELRVIRLPIESEITDGIQLVGIMETRAFDFKNVILVSCNEGIFPTSKSTNSFIPFELKKDLLPTYFEKESINAYLFYRLLQRAAQIYILYNTESDNLGGGEKSRFILQLQQEFSENQSFTINEYSFALDANLKTEEKEISIEKSPTLLAEYKKYLATKGLSPSALNTFVNCSLQFHFNYILKLKEEVEVDESIADSTIGTVVHRTLEEIYTPVLNIVLHAEYLDTFINNPDKIQELVVRFFKENNVAISSLKEGENYLHYLICIEMIVSFLKYERNRVLSEKMKNRTITLNFLEKNLVYEFIHNDIQLKLTGNTDRVETINGETFIYDYKSGTESAINISSQNDFFTVKNAKSIQLLMYAYLYEKSMLNVDTLYSGIIWLRSVKGKFDLLEIDIVANLNDANFDFFETNLLQLIDMMFDEKIPITKTDDCNNCKFCLYTGICGR